MTHTVYIASCMPSSLHTPLIIHLFGLLYQVFNFLQGKVNEVNEMFKLALANASRHVLLRSKVLEEVVCFYNVMSYQCFVLPVNE